MGMLTAGEACHLAVGCTVCLGRRLFFSRGGPGGVSLVPRFVSALWAHGEIVFGCRFRLFLNGWVV
eukprot:892860-Amorphochlora_amoeboformis.AAC.1